MTLKLDTESQRLRDVIELTNDRLLAHLSDIDRNQIDIGKRLIEQKTRLVELKREKTELERLKTL